MRNLLEYNVLGFLYVYIFFLSPVLFKNYF